jgi:hypothetical protein
VAHYFKLKQEKVVKINKKAVPVTLGSSDRSAALLVTIPNLVTLSLYDGLFHQFDPFGLI